jgi:GABA(A) receptor-associated protein
MTSSEVPPKYNNINTIDSPQFTRKKIEQLIKKYPDRVPILISSLSHKTHGINRFIVPIDMTVASFMSLLRKTVELASNETIFIFVKNNKTDSTTDVIAPTSATLGTLYEQYKDDKLVLNLIYEKENVFG